MSKERFDLRKLRENPRNPFPFEGTEEQWEEFKSNLEIKFLEAEQIAYDSTDDNLIIAGNKRTKALLELGYNEVPDNWVIDVKDWTAEQRRKYIIASNSHIGQWNPIIIEMDFADLAFDYDISFEEGESTEEEDNTSYSSGQNEDKRGVSDNAQVNIEDYKDIAGYKTAIKRKDLSAPVKFFIKNDLLSGSVLDYGCGLEVHDFEKFDPAYNPEYELLNKKYDTVICNYVINVIPLEHNRFELLRTLESLTKENGKILLSVYGSDSIDKNSHKGFQSGWGLNRWKQFIGQHYEYEVLKSSFWCFLIKLNN